MKVLLDTCVAGRLVMPALAAAGHDVIWTGDWPNDPGDEAILSYAHQQGRTLITLDKDFGALAVQRGTAHSGIVRLVNLTTREQASVCLLVLAEHSGELTAGALITAERTRLRIRLPG
jgi:predicted nuclease of predicted toxin-antitoxin system